MHKILSIALTELKLFFYTPIGYIISFVFYSINGVLFWYIINQANSSGGNIQGSIITQMTGGIVFWLLLFLLIPIITMRLIAYESESKRLLHLFTTPVFNYQITLGKFLGGLIFYLILWVPSFLYVFMIKKFCFIDSGILLSAYFGIVLVGSFGIAVGLFASSISGNQIESAIIAFFILLFILLISMFENMLPEASSIQHFFKLMNFTDCYTPFSEGIIDTKNIFYFVSGTILFLISTNEIINYKRCQ